MPNHITNKLTILGTNEQINKVLDFIKIEDCDADKDYNGKIIKGIGTIDFNKITPMPKWVFKGNLGVKEEQKYGAENCWYDWNITNWGTKWNAYGQCDKRNTFDTIYFETAWSGIKELIRKLSWIFPEVRFKYSWSDEDFGHNLGITEIQDGIILYKDFPKGGTKEAYDMAFEITQTKPEDREMEYDIIAKKYIYIEN